MPMLQNLSQREQRFYKEMSKMIRRINAKKSTVKSEVYKTHSPSRYHALLHRVILNYPLLTELVAKTEMNEGNEEMSAVLAYEVLRGTIRDRAHRKLLEVAIEGRELKDVDKKVYVRLNTLQAGKSILDSYCVEETCVPNVYELKNPPKTGDVQTDAIATELTTKKYIKEFFVDTNVKNKVKIQNLASCLPAFILNPPKNSIVIDATAAPGNKTTHLCSIMENTGKIYAFERDEGRYKTLVEQLEQYNATNTEAISADFLQINPEEYQADYILLDPSCSGSGIHLNYKKDQRRVDGLHNLQCMLLNHAFKFNPKKVVFSTCSVHTEEGEDVVQEALAKNPEYEIERIGNFWETRGCDGYPFSQDVIRAENTGDDTIGFFVALFSRKDLTEKTI